MTVRLQPSVGMAYLPSANNKLITTDRNGYQYSAGDYKTAVVSGLGIELDKGRQRFATLTLFYSKGLGSLTTGQIINGGNKVNNTVLNSKSSSWGMLIGIPISLTKTKKPIVVPAPVRKYSERSHQYRGRCGSYGGRCVRRV